MGKKKSRNGAQQNGFSASKQNGQKHDPWADIENGTAKTAYQEFYKPPEKEQFLKEKHYERFKQKRPLNNSGVGAERIEVHQSGKGIKRKNLDEIPSQKKTKQVRIFEQEDPLETFTGKKTKKQEKKERKRREKQEKERLVVHEDSFEAQEANYIVEEPAEPMVAIPKTNGFHKAPKRVTTTLLFDGEEDEGENHFAYLNQRAADSFGNHLFVGIDDEDEEIEDEDFDFEGLEDEEEMEDEELVDEEIDETEMTLDPNDIAEVISDDDEPYASPASNDSDMEELEDEEVSDEEGSCCDSCESEVSEQDAASDEEGNLGEDRTATVMKKINKSSPLNFDEFPFSDEDSAVTATRALAWMVSNCDVQTFFNDFYQQNCLVVQRNHPEFYGNLFSSQRLAELLEKNHIEYGVNINVAEYKNSIRTTMNGNGRAYPRQIKAHLKQGRSIQLVNPQAFDDRIWYFCEILQEIFGCFVGANTYLTPAGSSGFAPHWDDIDAFLLQVEGRKYWKIYAPESDDDELPRESSGNFTESDMKNRKPTFEGWLETGDMLYIPRGFIHQAKTDKKVHSLHVTVSTGRQWTFADVMEKLIPEAIGALAGQRMKMRKGLPIGLLDMSGVADYKYRMDEYFLEKFVTPLDRHLSMLRNFVADQAMESSVDLMAKEFMKTALPPVLTPAERRFHVLGQEGESLLHGVPLVFSSDIYVRLMRRHGQRLIFESEEKCFIAHRINNSRVYEGREEQTVEIDFKYVPAFTTLLDHTPEWTKVGELPELTDQERKNFCQLLYDAGVLLAKNVPQKKGKKESKKGK